MKSFFRFAVGRPSMYMDPPSRANIFLSFFDPKELPHMYIRHWLLKPALMK
jgi:hypothetical protein